METYPIPDYYLHYRGNNFYSVLTKNKKKMIIELVDITFPFGIEKYTYNDKDEYCIKMEFNDTLQYNFIKKLEANIQQRLNCDENIVNTQLIYSQNQFNHKLKLKLRQNKNGFETLILDKESKQKTVFELTKNQKYTIYIYLSVFYDENKLILKWFLLKCV